MAKFKPAGGKKTPPVAPTRGLIPCAIIVLLGMFLMAALFYYSMKSAGTP